MLCAYLDECGNTGSNIHDPLQRYHYVGALIVPEVDWESLRDDLDAIATAALGKTAARAASFEFHGNQLFSGNGVWVAIRDRGERLKIYGKCLDLLSKHKLSFAYGRCDKQALRRYTKPMHPHEVGFWLALERVGTLFKTRDSLGFIVADEGSKSIKQIARKGLADYRVHGPPFGRKMDISKVIDTIHFMDSVESPHLQLCDLCLWVVRRFRATPADGLMPAEPGEPPTLYDLYSKVSSRISGAATFPY